MNHERHMTFWQWLKSLFSRPKPKPAPVPSPVPSPSGAMLVELNTIRHAYRLALLADNSRADRLAQSHAETMSRDGILAHGDFDGRFKAVFPDRAGEENIAEGEQTAAEVVDDWMNERPDISGRRRHRENILNPSMTAAGCGRAGDYWCVVFLGNAVT